MSATMAAAATQYQRDVDHVEAKSRARRAPVVSSLARLGSAVTVDCGTVHSS